MITLLNFGDSPFILLFYLIAGITAATLLVNLVAYIATKIINHLTKKVLR